MQPIRLPVALALLSSLAVLLASGAAHGGNARSAAAGAIAFVNGGDVWLVQSDGTQARQVTKGPSEDATPALSHSGDKIVFSRRVEQNQQLFVVSADGTGLRRLVRSKFDDAAPSWSPDDERIVFSEYRGDGNCAHCPTQLRIATADGSRTRALTPVLEDIADFPEWSADGRYIAFGADGVFVIHADGTKLHGHDIFAVVDGYQYSNPTLSPDDKRIAFRDDRRIRVVDIDVEHSSVIGTHLLKGPSGRHDEPDWAPDGASLVFSVAQSGVSRLFTVRADGSHAQQLPGTKPDDSSPSWEG